MHARFSFRCWGNSSKCEDRQAPCSQGAYSPHIQTFLLTTHHHPSVYNLLGPSVQPPALSPTSHTSNCFYVQPSRRQRTQNMKVRLLKCSTVSRRLSGLCRCCAAYWKLTSWRKETTGKRIVSRIFSFTNRSDI